MIQPVRRIARLLSVMAFDGLLKGLGFYDLSHFGVSLPGEALSKGLLLRPSEEQASTGFDGQKQKYL
ncbi:hypothetical protein [Motiliproteus sp.]|uniref:hypothetical protein n=1 Tax=Motiliproteus sp. TaxID=1898955 RepID=UPI003BA8D3E1